MKLPHTNFERHVLRIDRYTVNLPQMFTVMFFSTLIQNLDTEPYKDFKYDSSFSVLPEISEFLST